MARAARGKSGTLTSYMAYIWHQVFHELARHLQTRRLVAGDSLSLDSDFSFYIVVDGHVQVFAPLPGNADGTSPTRPADSFDDEEHNGFQLLNEVESGGTLSSLFTILSLFTEDVKLGLGDEEESKFDFGAGAGRNTSRAAPGSPAGMRRGHQPASRGDEAASVFNNTPSSALRLDAAALRNVPNAATSGIAVERLGPPIFSQAGNAAAGGHSRRTSSSTATLQQAETETVMDGTEAAARGVHTSPLANGSLLNSPGLAPEFSMPPAQASAPFPVFSPRPKPQTAGSTAGSSVGVGSPQFRGRTTSSLTLDGRPSTPGSVLSGTNGQGRPSDQLHREGAGTVARATVDTTLAVIPAEAFKRLTKKFPNAAAHIVQGEFLVRT